MSKKRNIPPLAAAALTAALLAGCAGDSPSDIAPTPSADNTEIKVNADVWQMMEGTRATTFDSPTAIQQEGSFTCTAYDAGTTTPNTTSNVNGSLVKWNTGASRWEFNDGVHKWPTSGSLDFFAYMPAAKPDYISSITYAVDGTAPRPYFTCDMRETVDKEFIYALAPDQDKAGTNHSTQPTPGQVALTFRHPFARIYFKLSEASGTAVRINSITISGDDFYQTGTCTFDSTDPKYSTWSNKDGAGPLGTLAINTPYLVIPNDYGSSKTITVNVSWDEWNSFSKDFTSSALSMNWQAGYSYTYTLTVTKYALQVETTKYTEQW